jgi:hypothetical protein
MTFSSPPTVNAFGVASGMADADRVNIPNAHALRLMSNRRFMLVLLIRRRYDGERGTFPSLFGSAGLFQEKKRTQFPERSEDGFVGLRGNFPGVGQMRKIAISLAAGATALLATAASAGPLSNSVTVLPDSNIENVRMVCNEDGRCWRERSGRTIVRESYGYAPRERYIERRYYDEPRAGIGFRAPGVSVGIGDDRW